MCLAYANKIFEFELNLNFNLLSAKPHVFIQTNMFENSFAMSFRLQCAKKCIAVTNEEYDRQS